MLLHKVVEAWIGRRAQPIPEALASVVGLQPAAVITGASRGIGYDIARRFASLGHNVLLLARQPVPLEAAAATLRGEARGIVATLALDVTDPDAAGIIDRALAAEGLYLDILVNNAGVGLSGRFDSHGVDEVMRLLNINVAALTRLMHHALPAMRARARGGVLNVASLGGLMPGPYQAAYYASKAYVISLSEAVASEMAGEGVRISVLAPGPVNTSFHASMGAEGSLYRLLVPPLSAERAARTAVRGFRLGRRVIVPGFLNSGLALIVRVIPHILLVPFIGWLLAPPGDRGR